MVLPWATTLDVEWVGQHSYNTVRTVNINAVDFGAAFLPQNQNPNLARAPTPGGDRGPDRSDAGVSRLRRDQPSDVRRLADVPLAADLAQPAVPQRPVVRLQRHLGARGQAADAGARLQHDADGTSSFRADQAEADELLGDNAPASTSFKANFVWDLPDLRATAAPLRTLGLLINDWQLSGVWTGGRPARAYSRRLQLPERRRQREHHRFARLRRPRPDRRRSRAAAAASDVPSVQRRRVPGPAEQQRRSRIGAAATCAAVSRARSISRSRETSGWAAAATSSCASTCSTPSTRRASRTGTRACRWRVRQIQSRRSICRTIDRRRATEQGSTQSSRVRCCDGLSGSTNLASADSLPVLARDGTELRAEARLASALVRSS